MKLQVQIKIKYYNMYIDNSSINLTILCKYRKNYFELLLLVIRYYDLFIKHFICHIINYVI